MEEDKKPTAVQLSREEEDHDSSSDDTEIGLDMACHFEDFEEEVGGDADGGDGLGLGLRRVQPEPVIGVEPYQFEPVVERRVQEPGAEPQIDDDGDDGEERLQGIGNWCTCGKCVIMDTVRECICCHEVQRVDRRRKPKDNEAADCVTMTPGFMSVCLDHDVLETAFYGFCQEYGREIDQELLHEQYRYIAYRQMVRWCWGFLGRHVRVVLPSCVVTRIRQEFPAEGLYTGFRYPNEN